MIVNQPFDLFTLFKLHGLCHSRGKVDVPLLALGSLYDLDLTESVALLFGNEHFGLSREILAYTDGNFLIPQVGMAKSLNISVACAVTLYEAMRQRLQNGQYAKDDEASQANHEALVADYIQRHEAAYQGRNIRAKKK